MSTPAARGTRRRASLPSTTPIPLSQLGEHCPPHWRPQLLTGFFREVLTRHFGDPANIEHPDLLSYVWRDALDTGILIESVYRWRGENVGKCPAIIIKRNAYRNLRFSLGDQAGDDGRGTRHFATAWVGSHSLFCLHETGAAVDLLATEVQRELTEFAPVFKEYLGLLAFAVTEVGAVSEVEEATENHVVPVTVGWAYTETWALAKEAPPLWEVSLAHLCGCDRSR